MDNLKEILGEELFSQVTTKLGDKKIIIDNGNFIPKHRFDEVSDNLKAVKDLNKNYEEQVKQLKQSASGNEELTKKINDLENRVKEQQTQYEAKALKDKKTFALKESLLNEGVVDNDARELLSLRFDVDKIELDENGKPKGFSELVKPYKENPTLKNLFGQARVQGQEHNKGGDPLLGEYAGEKNPFNRKSPNLTKQIELHRTNPELAKRLQDVAV